MTCWVKLSADRNNYSSAWCIDSSIGNYNLLQTDNDGTTMGFFQSSVTPLATRAMTVGVWYFIAISVNGSSGTMVSRAANETAYSIATWSNGAGNTTHTNFRIGDSVYGGEWLNGSIAGLKWWSAALTQTQLEAEASQFLPVRTTNLRAYYRFSGPSTTDNSGNGLTLSGGSGASTDTDPVPFQSAPVRLSNNFDVNVADGTAITLANSGGNAGNAFHKIVGQPFYSSWIPHRDGGKTASNAIIGAGDPHLDWENVTQPGNTFCARMYIYRDGTPAGTVPMFAALGPSGVLFKAWMFNTGRVGVWDAGSDVEYINTGTSRAPFEQWVRFEWRFDLGTSGVGTLEQWMYFSADSAVHDHYAIANVAWGGVKPSTVEFHLRRDSACATYIDDIAISDVKLGSAFSQIAEPIDRVTESSTAQPISARKLRMVRPVSSAETVLGARVLRARRLSTATEADASDMLGRQKRRSVGQAAEAGNPADAAGAHALTLGRGIEFSEAQQLAASLGPIIRTLVESSIALPVTGTKIRHVGMATTADVVRASRPVHQRLLGVAADMSSAVVLNRVKQVRLRPASEISLAGRFGTGFVVLVDELDQALPIVPLLYRGGPFTGVEGPGETWSADVLRRRWIVESASRTWSADLSRRSWDVDPPRGTWSATHT
ncbi:Concanavalin A-like lectin/glucanases superfamily protein [Nonomuraea maritima]|uniref:Concanavalin A-like lectin/glucanases superfamily protein n=1 Tax=Nonomuraea maritima TaxID=683260 RepID=A0A1G9MHC1_9ACTN|nr:Concanavalin A-like lectin/glucanases superfamily protein [Nonomuraea maritima]